MKLLQKVFRDSGIPLRSLHFWGIAALYWGSFALVGFAQSSAYWSLQSSRGFTGTETLDLLLRALLWLLSTPLILYLAYRAPITTFQLGQLGRTGAVRAQPSRAPACSVWVELAHYLH